MRIKTAKNPVSRHFVDFVGQNKAQNGGYVTLGHSLFEVTGGQVTPQTDRLALK